MAGSAALLMTTNDGGGGGAPALSGFITPSRVSAQTTNGAWTSPRLTMNASGGTPPYTYEWSATAGFTVNSTSEEKTTVSKSGFDTISFSEVTCKVTDGSSDTIEATINVTAIFGNPL